MDTRTVSLSAANEIIEAAHSALDKSLTLFTAIAEKTGGMDEDDLQAQGLALIGKDLSKDIYNRIDEMRAEMVKDAQK